MCAMTNMTGSMQAIVLISQTSKEVLTLICSPIGLMGTRVETANVDGNFIMRSGGNEGIVKEVRVLTYSDRHKVAGCWRG